MEEHGYDGLVNSYIECGCSVDDLAPCDCINLDECVASYRRACSDCDVDNCDYGRTDGQGCYYEAEVKA